MLIGKSEQAARSRHQGAALPSATPVAPGSRNDSQLPGVLTAASKVLMRRPVLLGFSRTCGRIRSAGIAIFLRRPLRHIAKNPPEHLLLGWAHGGHMDVQDGLSSASTTTAIGGASTVRSRRDAVRLRTVPSWRRHKTRRCRRSLRRRCCRRIFHRRRHDGCRS